MSALTAPAIALKTDAACATGAPCAALPPVTTAACPLPPLAAGRGVAVASGHSCWTMCGTCSVSWTIYSSGAPCHAVLAATNAAGGVRVCSHVLGHCCRQLRGTLGASLPAPSGPLAGLTWMRLASA